MALRSRTALTNFGNQENVKASKGTITSNAVPARRAALGEIGNKVNSQRGTVPIGKTSLLPDIQKKTKVHQTHLKPPEKPRVQIVKPVVKIGEPVTTSVRVHTPVKKDPESFSSDLLLVEDIDEEDKGNPILASIYSNDIYAHLRSLEKIFPVHNGYLEGQAVTSKMRGILVDWLVEVHQQFHLIQETLYLTVAIIDRFLQDYRTIDRKRLQLVGVAAMFVASKYEEMYSPDIMDFVYITDNAYTKAEILEMEIVIVRTLSFSFGRPLPLHFLRRYSKAGKALPVHHTMAKFFLELSLVHYEMCHYSPSLIAAAALYLSFFMIGNDSGDEGKVVWTKTLIHYSTYTKNDVLPVVKDIAALVVAMDKSKHQAVRKKFSSSKYMKISLRPELKSPTMMKLASIECNE